MRKRAWVKIRTTMERPRRSEYRHRHMDNIHTYMIRTCMHAYMYTYMHTHTHTHTRTHTHTHTHRAARGCSQQCGMASVGVLVELTCGPLWGALTSRYLHTSTRARTHARTHTHTHTHTCMHACIHAYARMPTYMHTLTYGEVQAESSLSP